MLLMHDVMVAITKCAFNFLKVLCVCHIVLLSAVMVISFLVYRVWNKSIKYSQTRNRKWWYGGWCKRPFRDNGVSVLALQLWRKRTDQVLFLIKSRAHARAGEAVSVCVAQKKSLLSDNASLCVIWSGLWQSPDHITQHFPTKPNRLSDSEVKGCVMRK